MSCSIAVSGGGVWPKGWGHSEGTDEDNPLPQSIRLRESSGNSNLRGGTEA